MGNLSSMPVIISIFAIIAAPFGTAFAQNTNAVLNDLPNPYTTTCDWGELPDGTNEWAAVTAIKAAPDRTVYVIHRCFENS